VKAVYIEEYGGIDKLVYGDRPEPTVGPGEALIRVRAAALNHLDLFARAGLNAVSVDGFPRILGCDISGEVALVGDGVGGVAEGDRVLVDYIIRCNECKYCLMGRDELCANPRNIGVNLDGGYAEYAKVPQDYVHVIPDWLSFDEAAAIGVVGRSVWRCLITRAQLKPGEDILITAAGSGVGSAAIQLAKRIGARVITTAGTDEKLEKARELGADEAINYVKDERYSDRVKALTEGEGVDVVLDSVGASIWDENFKSLKAGGRLVNCGVTGGHRASLRIGTMFIKGITLLGVGMDSKAEFADMMRLVRLGGLRGVVGKTFHLKDAAEAHKVMESRNFFGKLILNP